MHSLRELARGLGSDTLPGIIVLLLGVAALCVWEVRHVTGGQASGGRERLITLIGVVLGAASCVLMAARFIWIA
jgi:hypothetical protein